MKKTSYVPYAAGAFGAGTSFHVKAAGQSAAEVVQNQFGQVLHASTGQLLEWTPEEMETPPADPQASPFKED